MKKQTESGFNLDIKRTLDNGVRARNWSLEFRETSLMYDVYNTKMAVR